MKSQLLKSNNPKCHLLLGPCHGNGRHSIKMIFRDRLIIPGVCRRRSGQPSLEARLVDEAAGAGAAAGRDERLGLAEVVADAAEGRRRAGRVRRRAGQPGQRGGQGRAEAAGEAAHIQRGGDLYSRRLREDRIQIVQQLAHYLKSSRS